MQWLENLERQPLCPVNLHQTSVFNLILIPVKLRETARKEISGYIASEVILLGPEP